MFKNSRFLLFILVAILLITAPTAVSGATHEKDIEGSKDHPLITRFPGSIIRHYDTRKSDEYIFPTGKDIGEKNEDGERLDSSLIVGDITRITYEAPADTSTLEIYNNYKSALEEAGFDIIFSGTEEELTGHWTVQLYRDINPLPPGDAHRLTITQEDFRYLSAELIEEKSEDYGDIYVSFITTRNNKRVGIQVDIIEVASPAEDLIEVNLDNIAREIEKDDSAVSGATHEKDIEGSKDHPLITRFPGSIIRHYDTRKSDEYIFPTGKDIGEKNEDGERLDSSLIVGDITRITYEAPADTSTLEIYNNYKSALEEAGFDIIFSGTEEELTGHWTVQLYRDINPLPPGDAHRLTITQEDFRYLSAELIEEKSEDYGDIYVSFITTRNNKRVGIQVDIIEVASPAEDLIEVNLDNIAREIEKKGSVSIHNIYFDTGKAVLKLESEEALTKIADFLNQKPDIKLYVVGHTDSQGSLEFNMDLSTRRAEAVVKALINEYDIESERLKAKGIAFLAPEASNESEKGRAFNRRVELVKP